MKLFTRRQPTPRPRPRPRHGCYEIAPSCQVTNLDVLLDHFLGCRTDGRFLEIGAFDGSSWSNTSGLAAAGWHGWYVEPVPEYAARCRERYAAWPNITVEELAIGAASGTVTMTVGKSLSTSNDAALTEFQQIAWAKNSFANSRRIDVKQITLNDFLDVRGIDALDLLVVDVEGNEPAVFAGFDLAHHRPTMMIVELADLHRDLVANRVEHERLGREIVTAGYRVVYKDDTNTVFVQEHL
ncbi:MAG TPA: FkbM family methyltransferase [Acidothermaceae bacterium]|jgi:FkbM family methyltransferase